MLDRPTLAVDRYRLAESIRFVHRALLHQP